MSTRNNKSRFAIVIPAYNEETTIHDIAQRALAMSDKVIIVDDGSADKTIERLSDLPVTLIKHEVNKGKAASLWDGFQEAMKNDIDIIITLDGDGQHAPEDIPLLLSKYEEVPDQIIIGARLANKADIPAKRYYANKIANFWIAWAAGYPLSDSQSGFRIYPVHLFKNLEISTSKNSSFVFESEIIIKAAQRGIHSQPVPIPAIYAETARPSHFRGVRDITLITLMVAKSLISRGMYLPGLYHSTIKPRLLPLQDGDADYDGYLMLSFSILAIIATGGLSWLLSWAYVFQVARGEYDIDNANSTLLVLGKRLINDSPDDEFKTRLLRAQNLLINKKADNAYILGGKTRNSDISEASAGKRFLVENDIDPARVHTEEDSRNTLENLKRFYALFSQSNAEVSLVTNRYHMARALIMAKNFGIRASAMPAEECFKYSVSNIFKTIVEGFHLHWYFTGKYWASLTNNKRMLDRIS